MAVVADLTKAELVDSTRDTELKKWWENVPELPEGIGLVEFFSKSLSSAYIAQIKKNKANNATGNEALTTYSRPQTGSVNLDIETGVQTFVQTHTLTAVYGIDGDLVVAQHG